jgi:hypothetical protein
MAVIALVVLVLKVLAAGFLMVVAKKRKDR